jgi:peptidoglycan/xylan/chitin deacetylase (PgdA/CDA1 family)
MRLLRRFRAPRAAVLVYHRVAETRDDPYGQAVRPETFARHLEALVREHPVVPLAELVENLPTGRFEDGTVAVTFDDGYEDNLSQALPIAAQMRNRLPLTVFVAVEPVLDGQPFWWDEIAGVEPALRAKLHARLKGLPGRERRGRLSAMTSTWHSDSGRPMTPDELRDLASRPGIGIGAHTLSHPSLALLPAVEQERELAEARTRLEELIGRPVTLLAYPFGKPGDVSDETQDLARRAGYRAAFTTVPTRLVPSSPVFALPRLTVHEWPAETLGKRLRELING